MRFEEREWFAVLENLLQGFEMPSREEI